MSSRVQYRKVMCRRVFLPAGQTPVRAAALLLPGHRLRALLHDRLRVLDVILAGPQGGAGPGGAGSDHPAGHVHHPGQHPELPPACRLHQGNYRSSQPVVLKAMSSKNNNVMLNWLPGDRCVVRGLRVLRVQRTAGVRSGQLCVQVEQLYYCPS